MAGRTERFVELAREARCEQEPWFLSTMRRLSLRSDPRLEDMLWRRLTVLAGDATFNPPAIRVPRASDLIVPGAAALPKLSWGTVQTLDHGAVPLATPLDPHHTLIVGRTGSGKSCAAAKMLGDVPIPVWIVEPEGDRVYQSLALRLGYEIIDCRRWHWSPLDPPPGCSPEEWATMFVTNAGEALFLGEGGRALLLTVLESCRRQHGDAFGIRQVYDALVQSRYRWNRGGRAEGFFESLRNRLEGLLVHPMFDCLHGADLGALRSKKVLYLCDSLGPDLYVLFVNYLLQWLRCAFMPTIDRVPKLLLVVEELHRLTSQQRLRRASITEPIALDAIRTLAKRSVAVLVVDQSPGELPPVVFGNAACRVILNLLEARDLDAVQRSLGLSWEQRDEVARLPARTALLQQANPNYPAPFLVEIGEVQLEREIEAAVAERIAATHASLRFEAQAPVVARGGETQRRERADAGAQLVRGEADGTATATSPMLSKSALDYLIEISKDQFVPASRRDVELEIPLSAGNALRNELEATGLVTLEHVNTYSRSRRVVNTRITDKGCALLVSMKVPFEKPRGKGSWEHLCHQQWIAAWGAANGYRASIEHFHDGKSVDVLLEKGLGRIAAEVLVHGVTKELANVRDLFTGYAEMWFCVADRQTAKNLEARIRETFGDEANEILKRVSFKMLAGFQQQVGPEG